MPTKKPAPKKVAKKPTNNKPPKRLVYILQEEDEDIPRAKPKKKPTT